MNPINNADNTTNDKKWKVLNEKGLTIIQERYLFTKQLIKYVMNFHYNDFFCDNIFYNLHFLNQIANISWHYRRSSNDYSWKYWFYTEISSWRASIKTSNNWKIWRITHNNKFKADKPVKLVCGLILC